MKMILKTMVCLAVAFSGTAGAANYSPEKSQASLALKVPGNPAVGDFPDVPPFPHQLEGTGKFFRGPGGAGREGPGLLGGRTGRPAHFFMDGVRPGHVPAQGPRQDHQDVQQFPHTHVPPFYSFHCNGYGGKNPMESGSQNCTVFLEKRWL